MRRRRFLTTAATMMALTVAGCSGGDGTDTPGATDTETDTDTPTDTETEADVLEGTGTTEPMDATTAAADADTTIAETDTETETPSPSATPTLTDTATQTPTDTATPTDTETATPTVMQTTTPSGGGTGSLEVIESELVVEEGQYTTTRAMTALLENTGNGTLRIPEVEVSFYNEDDAVLSSTTRSIYFLEPGDQWDVRVQYLEDTEPARGEITVASTEVYQTELGIPEQLEVAEQNLETGAEPTISATIENTSDNPVDAAAFAVFYAEDSVALAGAFDTITGLAGGESWAVTLEAFITPEERAQRVTDYTLYANIP